MDSRGAQDRRLEHARERQLRVRRARFLAGGSLIAISVLAAVIVFGSAGGTSSSTSNTAAKHSTASGRAATASRASAKPGPSAVPILTYHVVNVPPPQSTAPPSLYVPAPEFSAQMDALKAGGWHPVTLDQLQAYWTRGVALGSGKPIVITFDGGYASQYTNALPVLKRLGWVAVDNIQASGLPPTDGGLADSQIHGLIAAGWELDVEGVSHADLTVLGPGQLQTELTSERQTLRSRYGAPFNWFSYQSGRYNATLTAAVHTAGFVGATTVVSGWASPQSDRFRLPRLQVVAGTSPSKLLAQISSAQRSTSAPTASAGA